MRKKMFTLFSFLLISSFSYSKSFLPTLKSSTVVIDTQIAFKDEVMSVSEDVGSVQITLLLQNPVNASVDVVLKSAPYSTSNASDLSFTRQTLHFTGNSNPSQTITIPIKDDGLNEMDEYFVISLENLKGITLQRKPYLTVYIRDNDRKAPRPKQDLQLNYISSFKPNSTEGSTTEIVVHDPASQRLFMTSAIQNRLDIADFSNPAAVKLIKSIDMSPYGGITSVAVRNGVVAVASPNADEQQNGSVVFFNTNGDFQKKVTVGALPDMITFTPDGKKILTANEGQPNDEYTVDPEGSISIIDIRGGLSKVDQSKVTTLLFTDFNAQEKSLLATGVRKTNVTSTLSQDFEPEYITVSADSKMAWATLQENNAMAEINLEKKIFSSVWAFGTKDFQTFGNGFDASDRSDFVHLANYPVKSFYLPDAVANFKVNNKTYLITANEGDEKEYSNLNERTTVGDVVLDPGKFPNASELQENYNLGRLRISNLQGDDDNDGDFDQLFMVGARSFSIWDATTKTLVYDSKDDFELITSTDPSVAPIFNADNEDNDFKSRSRAKGPEPEGVTVATIKGQTYAFITLERIGGVMVYNVTDPTNVEFVDYKNNRSLQEFMGDHGPEGITFISNQDSPDKKNYIAVANEISGTISIYAVKEDETPETVWNLRYGGSGVDRFTVVINTPDGGYLSGGYSNSEVSGDKSQNSRGGADYWIIKTDALGKKLWDQRYGGSNHDYLNRIIPTLDGGYLLAGSSTSSKGGDKSEGRRGDQDYWIVKISSDGTKQWDKTYGGSGLDDLRKVNQLSNGDYLLAGTSDSPVSGEKSQSSQGGLDYWIVRVTSKGVKLWDKRYGSTDDEYLESFTKTSNGGFLLAGSSTSGKGGNKTQDSRGGKDYWLVHINNNGTQLWDKSYGGSQDDELYSIGITPTDEYFVAGHSSSGQNGDKSQPSQGSSDYWMLKLNINGEKLWDKSFGGSGKETLRSIIQVQGGYVLAGSSNSPISGDKTQSSQGGTDYWIVKTDAAGNKEYDQRFGGAGNEEFRYIHRTEDGGLLLGGRSDSGISGDRTQPSQGTTDYWFVKIVPEELNTSVTARIELKAEPTAIHTLVSYPNPAVGYQVTFAFILAQTKPVSLKIYDTQSREIGTLYQGLAQKGQEYKATWSTKPHAPGMYILRLQTPNEISTQKLIISK